MYMLLQKCDGPHSKREQTEFNFQSSAIDQQMWNHQQKCVYVMPWINKIYSWLDVDNLVTIMQAQSDHTLSESYPFLISNYLWVFSVLFKYQAFTCIVHSLNRTFTVATVFNVNHLIWHWMNWIRAVSELN